MKANSHRVVVSVCVTPSDAWSCRLFTPGDKAGKSVWWKLVTSLDCIAEIARMDIHGKIASLVYAVLKIYKQGRQICRACPFLFFLIYMYEGCSINSGTGPLICAQLCSSNNFLYHYKLQPLIYNCANYFMHITNMLHSVCICITIVTRYHHSAN